MRDKPKGEWSAGRPKNSFDGFQHIIRAIAADLQRSDLLSLRRTSHLMCSIADEILCRHVVILYRNSDATFTSADGSRIPGLRYEKSSPRAIKERCAILLANARILDYLGGNPSLFKARAALKPYILRLHRPAESTSSRTFSPPAAYGQHVQVDFCDLFSPMVEQGSYSSMDWPHYPTVRARLSEKSVREWILHLRFHVQQPRLSRTLVEVAWPGNGPERVTLIVSALDILLPSSKITDDGPKRRLGLLHDLVVLVAANRHIQWTLVVDIAHLPDGALGGPMPSDLDSKWLADAVHSMVIDNRGGAGTKPEVYTSEEYRHVRKAEEYTLHTVWTPDNAQ